MWIRDNEECKNIISSDEERFNLERPDCFNCYWHDLRKAIYIWWSRRFKGEYLMLWGSVSKNLVL